MFEVGFGVYADGVELGGSDVDAKAVLEEAELFEALGLFEGAVGQGWELLERGVAICVEADVLPVGGWRGGDAVASALVAVVGDGGAGEVEGAAVVGGDDFYGVGVGDVLRGAKDFEGGYVDSRLAEGLEQGGDVFGLEEGFVALDVDVEVGGVELGDGVEAVGAGGQVGRGHLEGPIVPGAKFGDFFRVCSDENAVELRACAGGFVDPGEHGASGDAAEDFAGEAGGGQAGRDDSEDGGFRGLWLGHFKFVLHS